jgi:hypothetical protein
LRLNYHRHLMMICGMKERKTLYQKKRSKPHYRQTDLVVLGGTRYPPYYIKARASI